MLSIVTLLIVLSVSVSATAFSMQVSNLCQYHFYYYLWDETGELITTRSDCYRCYRYDANGERVYKLTGTSSIDQVNSGHTRAQVVFDDAVLYPNPYIVVTPKGYTKHYYVGTERLATVIGGGGLGVQDTAWSCIDKPTPDEEKKAEMFYRAYGNSDPFMQKGILSDTVPTMDIGGDKREELVYRGGAILMDNLSLLNKRDMLYYAILDNAKTNRPEEWVFYCHSDHLGSANWITETNGKPIQYIQYAPFGELLINETSYGYDERYKFTGKERDAETGYDYFGARYYSYALGGHWLSVDPMSDKYPHITPYAYCSWNPVNRIDPNGMDDWDVDIYGYIVNHTENTSIQDNVYLGRTGGNEEYVRFASKTFDHGLINEDNSFGTDITSFHVTDENTATELFLFLATENIQVEVGLINTADDGSYLITDHKQSSIPLTQNALKLDKQGNQVSSLMHNHPKGHEPSTQDTKAAQYFNTSQGANVEHRVYNGYMYVFDRNNLTWKRNE